MFGLNFKDVDWVGFTCELIAACLFAGMGYLFIILVSAL